MVENSGADFSEEPRILAWLQLLGEVLLGPHVFFHDLVVVHSSVFGLNYRVVIVKHIRDAI